MMESTMTPGAGNGKICVPIVTTTNNGNVIADKFNRATKYMIIDPEELVSSALPIEEVILMFSANNGQGFKNRGISYIIGSGISEHAMKILLENQVKVIEPIGNNIHENVNCLLREQLVN